jgi:hypothetical protein
MNKKIELDSREFIKTILDLMERDFEIIEQSVREDTFSKRESVALDFKDDFDLRRLTLSLITTPR